MIHGPVETFPCKVEVAPEAIKMVQLVRALGAKPDNRGWVPGVWWKEVSRFPQVAILHVLVCCGVSHPLLPVTAYTREDRPKHSAESSTEIIIPRPD